MELRPQSFEGWFKTAAFLLGFTLIASSAIMYLLTDRAVSWELMAAGLSCMGFPAFVQLDQKVRNGNDSQRTGGGSNDS